MKTKLLILLLCVLCLNSWASEIKQCDICEQEILPSVKRYWQIQGEDFEYTEQVIDGNLIGKAKIWPNDICQECVKKLEEKPND